MANDGACEVMAGGERLWLLPQRAAYWPVGRTLLVADAHLGKAAAFRRAGVPVPAGTTQDDLRALSRLIELTDAARVAFLGDLVHSRAALDAATPLVSPWRERHAKVEMLLVRGNHDRNAGALPTAWGMQCVDEPAALGSLALLHEPRSVSGAYAIGGHLHPGIRIAGRGRQRVRVPCFLFGTDFAVLPAFGGFTGLQDVRPDRSCRVYCTAGERVVPLCP